MSAILMRRLQEDVLVPLAVRCNAVIICEATNACFLSNAFTRAVSIQRAKWGAELPFSIISATGLIMCLYKSPEGQNDVWRSVRESSKNWQARDAKLKDFSEDFPGVYDYDLDPNASTYLIFDCIDVENDICPDRRAYNKLMHSIMHHLSSRIPSIAIKAGCSVKASDVMSAKGEVGSLSMVVDALHSGTPVLLLDLRRRPSLDDMGWPSNRKELIERAKNKFDEACDALLAEGPSCMTVHSVHCMPIQNTSH